MLTDQLVFFLLQGVFSIGHQGRPAGGVPSITIQYDSLYMSETVVYHLRSYDYIPGPGPPIFRAAATAK